MILDHQYGLESGKLVETLVQCSLRQLLESGFFHADPHAGNLLATPSGQLLFGASVIPVFPWVRDAGTCVETSESRVLNPAQCS